MGRGLTNKVVVLTASRKTEEMSLLIEKQGGTAKIRSMQGTVFVAKEQLEADVRLFLENQIDWLVLTTGMGTSALIDVADQLGAKEAFIKKLHQVKIAARGYKTMAVLHKLGIKPTVVDDDGTTGGLISALQGIQLTNQHITVQLHGLSSPQLIQFLENQGAIVKQVLPYQHIKPEDKVAFQLLDELFNHQVDAVCFTTFLQVRSLFDYARKKHCLEKLLDVFERTTIACAVGKLTNEELRAQGVSKTVSPKLERMGAMILELSRHYKNIHEN
ncbi:uroporphyrinogen-III synthase [Alkalihalobacillus pseudalcaliphilus]|uniref:uroporphyrinogen-III synthase n=1 Tax=Alkalihalobacillus pseudalcaliphilus TaxID=79884 RepID=UPI00064DF3C5|nr:uroporphyrinogen-III synthase [Alkalihalobacillus pseudalcaliphilus]KMK76513.1 uroporphyrinogen-III synthase [Alkalihalobacillus pseudalcaliphilus]